MRRYPLLVIFCFLVYCFSTSCKTYKNFSYFQDFSDSAKPLLAKTVSFVEPTIRPDDILNITISTLDANMSAAMNSTNVSIPGSGSSGSSSAISGMQPQAVTGYLVDKSGNVELPIIGKIPVVGLTTVQAKDSIEKAAEKSFNGVVVSVRYANFKITVLGEVLHPSTYIVPNEKINIFDALGMAGDITVYGRKENVLLMRDTLGNKKIIRLNLNSKDIISSPWFFLRPNDVVYIQANKYKLASIDAVKTRTFAIAASSFTVILAIISFIRK